MASAILGSSDYFDISHDNDNFDDVDGGHEILSPNHPPADPISQISVREYKTGIVQAAQINRLSTGISTTYAKPGSITHNTSLLSR